MPVPNARPGPPVPATTIKMRKHLRRLERVWIDWPTYFITTCTFKRRPILASNEVARILADEWRDAHDRHGWVMGRYVIMPDHVHFFCEANWMRRNCRSLCGDGSSGRASGWLASSSFPGLFGRKSFLIMSCAQARALVRNGIMLGKMQCVLVLLQDLMNGHGKVKLSR